LNTSIKTYGAAFLSAIFWAFSFIWYKEAAEDLNPITIVFLRLLFSVIFLSLFLIIKKDLTKIRKRDRKLFLMMATFEPFLYFIGESYGLRLVSANVGSVITSVIPVFAGIGAWLFFREKLKVINYIGIIVSFIGILVFLLNKNGGLTYNLTGVGLMFFAVFSAVGYNLTLSRLVNSYNPVFIVNIQNIIGTILFLPLFLIIDLNKFIISPFSSEMLIPVAKLAIFSSSAAFVLFAYAVQRIGIVRANAFINCVPIFTAVFAFFLLHEKLSFQNITGMVIVIAGLFLSQMNGRKKVIDEALIITGKTA
jgi:drug/metabolite transporter (DMT)-like permease